MPGFSMTFWHGLWVPKGTPKTRSPSSMPRWSTRWPIRRCEQRFAQSARTSCRAQQQTPEALGAHHKAEIEKWWPIIKAAGIKAE